jgi:hypothetical protein
VLHPVLILMFTLLMYTATCMLMYTATCRVSCSRQ